MNNNIQTFYLSFLVLLFAFAFTCCSDENEEELSPDNIININGQDIYVHPTDNSTGIQWYNGEYIITEATSTDDGKANTTKIISVLGDGDYAACLCDKLEALDYNDWYLPSKEELDALYQNKEILGGFSPEEYWSSTEEDNDDAYYQSFETGQIMESDEKNYTKRVRCIRKD